MKGELPLVLQFSNAVGAEAAPDDTVARNTVNLLGDICSVAPSFGALLSQAQGQGWQKLVAYCQESDHLAGDTDWAVSAIHQSVSSGGS